MRWILASCMIFSVVSYRGIAPTPASAEEPEPRYHFVEHYWDKYKAQYAGDYPAVVVEKRVFAEVGKNGSSKQTKSIIIAVFDIDRIEDVLNHVEVIPYGLKVKNIRAWSVEHGSGKLIWAQKSDIYERKLFGDFTEVRIAIPGFNGEGICGIELEMKGEGLQDVFFTESLPVIEGEVRVEFKSPMQFNWDMQGAVTKETSKKGNIHIWKARDLPPENTSPIRSARHDPPATLLWLPFYWNWDLWAKVLGEYVYEKLEAPAELAEAMKDTLSGVSTREVVEAIARYVDDPANIVLKGGPRDGIHGSAALEEAIEAGEGTALTKCLLAGSLLNAFEIKSHLVLGASRNRTHLDWENCDPWMFDAALIWIPELTKFIWDVADRSVPLGHAGADLYKDMFVAKPGGLPRKNFRKSKKPHEEIRRSELVLDEAGVLSGVLECRFRGMPHSGLDPWGSVAEAEEEVARMLPGGSLVHSVSWAVEPGSGFRCTYDNPAVLTCEVEITADPHGKAGWAVSPVGWELPAGYLDLVEAERKYAVYIPRSTILTDSILVRPVALGDTLDLIDSVDIADITNDSGTFSFSCRPYRGGVLVCRRLWIKARESTEAAEIAELVGLCKAWESSQGMSFGVAARHGLTGSQD